MKEGHPARVQRFRKGRQRHGSDDYQDGPADKVFTFVRWMTGREKGNVPKAGFAPDMAMLGGRPLRDLFDAEFEGTIGALWSAGRPIVRMEIGKRDEEHVGAFLHFWEWVTAIAGTCAGVDPFDQPGVELGKRLTYGLMGRSGYPAPELPDGDPRWRV